MLAQEVGQWEENNNLHCAVCPVLNSRLNWVMRLFKPSALETLGIFKVRSSMFGLKLKLQDYVYAAVQQYCNTFRKGGLGSVLHEAFLKAMK